MRQTSRIFGERLDMLAPTAAPEVPGDHAPPQPHRLHLYAAGEQTVYLRDGPCSLLVDGYVAWIPVHSLNLLFRLAGLTRRDASPSPDTKRMPVVL